MAFLGLRRGDITIHGVNGEDQFGLRWHRLLFPADGMPAVHFGPVTANVATPAPDGHAEPTVTMPIDANSAAPADHDFGGFGPTQTAAPAAQADAGSAAGSTAFDNVWHPPYFAPEPLVDGSGNPSVPSDSAPPGGFIPKSEALIWSGPAVMAFPGEPHDAGGDAVAPGTAGTPDAGDTVVAPDVGSTADAGGTPDAVTRADLDPVLAAMGSGADHGTTPDSGGGDLSAAFLPPDSSDAAALGHGLDPGFSFTLPPLPPPPDMI